MYSSLCTVVYRKEYLIHLDITQRIHIQLLMQNETKKIFLSKTKYLASPKQNQRLEEERKTCTITEPSVFVPTAKERIKAMKTIHRRAKSRQLKYITSQHITIPFQWMVSTKKHHTLKCSNMCPKCNPTKQVAEAIRELGN